MRAIASYWSTVRRFDVRVLFNARSLTTGALLFSGFAFLLHTATGSLLVDSFAYGKSDTALYENGLWMTGRLENPVSYAYPGFIMNVFLGQHVMLAGFIYGLIHDIGNTLYTTIIIEAISFSITILVIFRIAFEVWNSRLVGLILAGVFWASFLPSPGHFYFENLAAPFVALSAYWTWRENGNKASLTWITVLLFKEYFAFVSAIGGLIIYLKSQRRNLQGLILLGISFVYFLIAFQVIMPWAQPRMQFLGMFGYLGSSVTEIIWNFLTKPQLWIVRWLDPVTIKYLFALVAPFGLAGLLGLEFIGIALPVIALNVLISGNHATVSILDHYTVAVLPLFATAGIVGLRRFWQQTRSIWAPLRLGGRGIIIICILAATLGGIREHVYQFKRAAIAHSILALHSEDARAVLSVIPDAASVAATDQMMPYVSERRSVINPANIAFRTPDYVVVDEAYDTCLPAMLEEALSHSTSTTTHQDACYDTEDWDAQFTKSGAETKWIQAGYKPILKRGSIILYRNSQLPGSSK
jgi:uncharacterized membrane protein